MSDLLDRIFRELQTQITSNTQQLETLTKRSEAAGYAQQIRPCTLAEANAEISSTTGWTFTIITDGRKVGEGAGNGTGVPAYLDQGNNPVVWKRFGDDTAVVT